MITLAQCVVFAGLSSKEMILGATPSARHNSLLSSYLLNLDRGPVAVRDMIVADLRSFLDLGARQRAADLLIVLRSFLYDYPQARGVARRHEQVHSFLHSSNVRYQNQTALRSEGLGARALKKETSLEPHVLNSDPRVAHAEDNFDAAGGEEEDGVILSFSRRRVALPPTPPSQRPKPRNEPLTIRQ